MKSLGLTLLMALELEDNWKEIVKEISFITRMMQHQPRKINSPDIKEIQVVTSLDKYEKKIGRNVVEIYMDRDYTYA